MINSCLSLQETRERKELVYMINEKAVLKEVFLLFNIDGFNNSLAGFLETFKKEFFSLKLVSSIALE